MSDLISREIQLVSRPQGMPTAANFALVETKLELLKDEWVLVRNLYLSVDPYSGLQVGEVQLLFKAFSEIRLNI